MPNRGGDGARRVVQPAARHSAARPGWWCSSAGCPAARTSKLGTLPPGLDCGSAWRVVQLAGLARSALCQPAWAVMVHGGSTYQLLSTQGQAREVAGTGVSSGRLDLHTWDSVEQPALGRGPAGKPAGHSALEARPGSWQGPVGRLTGWTIMLGTLTPNRGGDGARRVVQPARLACSTLCRVAWAVEGSSGSTSLLLGTRHPAWVVARTGGSSGQLDFHAWYSVDRPRRWRGLEDRPAGRTCTLGTLMPGQGGDGARRVVQPAGLARSTLCCPASVLTGHIGLTIWPLGTRRPAWVVVGTGRSSSRPDLHARHFPAWPGW